MEVGLVMSYDGFVTSQFQCIVALLCLLHACQEQEMTWFFSPFSLRHPPKKEAWQEKA